jgi:hypothetical protein
MIEKSAKIRALCLSCLFETTISGVFLQVGQRSSVQKG